MTFTNEQIYKIVKAIILLPKSSVELSVSAHVTMAMIKKAMLPTYEGIEDFKNKKEDKYIEYINKANDLITKYNAEKLNDSRIKFNSPDDKVSFKKEQKMLEEEYADAINNENIKIDKLTVFMKEEVKIQIPKINSTEFTGILKDEMSKTIIEYLLPVFNDVNTNE